VMFYHMPRIVKQGYSIRMRVHDELITYTPDGVMHSAGALSNLMAAPHDWASGLPLAAAGFEGYRYKKED